MPSTQWAKYLLNNQLPEKSHHYELVNMRNNARSKPIDEFVCMAISAIHRPSSFIKTEGSLALKKKSESLTEGLVSLEQWCSDDRNIIVSRLLDHGFSSLSSNYHWEFDFCSIYIFKHVLTQQNMLHDAWHNIMPWSSMVFPLSYSTSTWSWKRSNKFLQECSFTRKPGV